MKIYKKLLLAMLMISACGSESDNSNKDDGQESEKQKQGAKETKEIFGSKVYIPASPLELQGNLVQPSTCTQAEDYIRESMLNSLKMHYAQQVEYYEQYGSDGGIRAESTQSKSMENAMEDSGAANDSLSTDAPDDFTTTNTQVKGVDGADFIKNSGTHIYALRGHELHIAQSWPADQMKSLSITKFDDQPIEMMLDEKNRIIIAARPKIKVTTESNSPGSSKESVSTSAEGAVATDSIQPYTYNAYDYNSVRLLVVDVKDPKAPKILEKYLFQGSYSTLRRIGNSIKIVLNSYIGVPEGSKYAVNSYDYPNKTNFLAALQEEYKFNVDLINKQKIKDLISYNRSYWGNYVLVDEEGKMDPVQDDKCSNIFLPTTPSELGLTNLATVDLDKKTASQTILLTHSGIVYASLKSLYIAAPYWWWWNQSPENTDRDYTYIHKFDIEDAASSGYMGSGRIPGTLKDQFAMDEHKDYLRIATTVNVFEEQKEQKNDDVITDWNLGKTFNQVQILGQGDKKLELVGQSEELAEGERIYSSRFSGDRGFVVTFRQVDPLFTLDLSNPKKPVVLGELKIPGFSNYMQLIDENHILTIGMEADSSGRVMGEKISVFDVTDMKNPKELFTHAVTGDGWSYSEAQYEHKAFTYFPSKGVLGIPVTGYRDSAEGDWWTQYYSALKVFKIDLEKGISPLGEVVMDDLFQSEESQDEYRWYNFSAVRRSIFADDFVYAISNAGVRSVKIDALDTTLSTVSFPCDDECYEMYWYY